MTGTAAPGPARAQTILALLASCGNDPSSLWGASASAAQFVSTCGAAEADTVLRWLMEHPDRYGDLAVDVYSAWAVRPDADTATVQSLLQQRLLIRAVSVELLQRSPTLADGYLRHVVARRDWDLLDHVGLPPLPSVAGFDSHVLELARKIYGSVGAAKGAVDQGTLRRLEECLSHGGQALRQWFSCDVHHPAVAALRPAWVTDPATARACLSHVGSRLAAGTSVEAVLMLLRLVPDADSWEPLLSEHGQRLRGPFLRARAAAGLVDLRSLRVDDVFLDDFGDDGWEPRFDLPPALWERIAEQLSDPGAALPVLMRLLGGLEPGEYDTLGQLLDLVESAAGSGQH